MGRGNLWKCGNESAGITGWLRFIDGMIVREENFEVSEKFEFLSASEKEKFGISQDDCAWTDAEFLKADDFCFFCSKPLTLPCCMWHGEGRRQIYFHPKCVHEFAHRLMRDAEELSIGKEDADELLKQRQSRRVSAS